MENEDTMSAVQLKAAQEELEYLKTVRRREIAEELIEARSRGDLCENKAYDRAKDAQIQLEERIEKLEKRIMSALIVSI